MRWLAVLVLVVACGDSTAPRPTIAVTICDRTSHWIAYQNEGGRWTHLGAEGTHSFMATPRVAIARARFLTQAQPPGTGSRVYVDYLTAEQANVHFTCREFPGGPGGMIGGSVAGASEAFYAQVYYGGIGAHMTDDLSAWSMEAQAVPATLVAVRHDSSANAMFADRVIIRRARSYLPGAAIPLIDFASDEAFTPQLNTVSFSEPGASLNVWYFTGGHEHFLSSVPPADAAMQSGPIHTVPEAQLAEGDIHQVSIVTNDGRDVSRFVRAGSDFTLAPGPALAAPTISTVALLPHRRFRVEMPRQAEYGASVEIGLLQLTDNFDRSSQIWLHASREYFGETSSTWSFEVPDFSAVPGFQLVGMFADGDFSWVARATDARIGLEPSNAEHGETTRGARRSGNSP